MVRPDYLLDSSVCIPVLRNQAGLDSLPPLARCGIPVVVAAELWTGFKKVERTHPQKGAQLEDFLSKFPIVDFDRDAALRYGEIRAALEQSGTSIGPYDLLIAAQALSLGATLVTANVGEFKRVKGLKILPMR